MLNLLNVLFVTSLVWYDGIICDISSMIWWYYLWHL